MDKETFVKLLKQGSNVVTKERINWADVLTKLAERTEPFTAKDVYEMVERKRDELGIRMKLNAWADKGVLTKIKVDGRVFYLHTDQITEPTEPAEED